MSTSIFPDPSPEQDPTLFADTQRAQLNIELLDTGDVSVVHCDVPPVFKLRDLVVLGRRAVAEALDDFRVDVQVVQVFAILFGHARTLSGVTA